MTWILFLAVFVVHVEHFWTWTCFEGFFIRTDNNYKLLKILQQVNVYLNKLIKIDELIRLSNQSIQRYTRDRKSKKQQFLFLKARNKLFIWSLKEKKEKKVIFWFLRNGIWKKKRTDWRNGWISLNILENQLFQRTEKIIEMNDIVILAEVDGCTISWKVS